ncbi:hypothetical protein EGW08_021004, partial [Elysia chlorotica]
RLLVVVKRLLVAVLAPGDVAQVVDQRLPPLLQHLVGAGLDVAQSLEEQALRLRQAVNDTHLMQHKRVSGRNASSLTEESFSQLGVVGQTILEANVENREVLHIALDIAQRYEHVQPSNSPTHDLRCREVGSHSLIVIVVHAKRVSVGEPGGSMGPLQGCRFA